ncbi:unnamed protein product [Gadus morhua 'NCC']
MKSRLCSVDTFILFLPSARMWFMALKPLSHSAVHTRSVETAVRTLRMLSPVTFKLIELLQEYGTGCGLNSKSFVYGEKFFIAVEDALVFIRWPV